MQRQAITARYSMAQGETDVEVDVDVETDVETDVEVDVDVEVDAGAVVVIVEGAEVAADVEADVVVVLVVLDVDVPPPSGLACAINGIIAIARTAIPNIIPTLPSNISSHYANIAFN